jgi:hypothetical protein
MEGATHFIEQYRHINSKCSFTPPVKIEIMRNYINAGKNLFTGYKTIAIFFIKPKQNNHVKQSTNE